MNAAAQSSLVAVLAGLLLVGCRPEPLPDRAEALASLVAAERAFAQMSVEEGRRAAFLEYLAEGSLIFSPAPTDGRALYTARSESPGTLAWAPAFADVAATGDLGYTTGPWTRRDSTGTAVSFGHYVSIWRRPPGGPWRVEIDAGIGHPPLDESAPERVAVPAAGEPVPALRPLFQEAARVALKRTDRALGEASTARGAVEAFRAVMTDSVRVYRAGSPPGLGPGALEAVLARDAGVLAWVPRTAAVSQAGDLGYTYGVTSFRAPTDSTARSSSYLRIWKIQPDSVWGLVLDLALVLPEE